MAQQQDHRIVTDTNKKPRKISSCPAFKKCGGCQWIDMPYEQQLKEKQKKITELCKPFCRVEPMIGMENPWHYRNKVHAVFGMDKRKGQISGIYEAGTHKIVPLDTCMIENTKADEIIVSIRGLLKSFKIKTYDEDTGYGLLRHVLVRIGHNSGEIMVVLVLASPILPSKNNFTKALLKLHPEITTIVLNVNDRRTSMVLGTQERVLYGKGYIEDELCGKIFRISPQSFYQVSADQTEILYHKAIELAGLSGREAVLDAYCGTGTIGIIASEKAGRVIGVELNKAAVKDAVINARRNHIKNIDFYQKDAGEFMIELAEQKVTIDVVLMDPPRSGSDEAFLSSLVRLNPGKIVYISCNPETMVRDLKYVTGKGYRVKRCVPVDMFAMTTNMECICLLTRNK